jgi:hypothetical protein
MSTTPEALAPQDADVSAAPAQPDGAEPESANEAAPSAAATAKPSDSLEPEAKGVQRRFDELTRYRREAERDRDYWRELATRQAPKAPEPVAPPQEVKTLADFQFDEGKHQSYLMQQAARSATEAAKAELKADQDRQAKERRAATYVQRVREFAKDKPDYQEVASHAPISDSVADIIITLETGPELAYYLGNNPDVASQISNLPNAVAAYELGTIAARLKFERETASKAKNLVSAAPPPSPTIGAGGGSATAPKVDSPDSDSLSDAEWTRRRNAQEAARLRKQRGG